MRKVTALLAGLMCAALAVPATAATITFTGSETDFTGAGVPALQVDGIDTQEFCGPGQYPLDIQNVYVTSDATKLYIGFKYKRECFCDIQLGIALDTGAGGTATDPFNRPVNWSAAPSPPDFYVYDVIPTNCNGYNYEVLYASNGAGGWNTVQDGSNGLGMVDTDGGDFVELSLDLATLGLTPCSTVNLELFVTQDDFGSGLKPAFDMVANDAEQRSTVGSTCFDVGPGCPASAPSSYLTYDPNCPPPSVAGVNLGWSNCATNGTTMNRAFTCDDNGTSFSLVGSFKNGFDVADFVAVSAAVDVSTSSPSIPAWFSFGVGGCREGELSLGNVGNLAGCTNPYSGANQGGGLIVENGSSPDRFRVRLDWARDIPGMLSGGVLNTAFVLGMSSANSFDEGFGMCAGCNVPACFVLNAVEVYSNSQGRVRIIESADVRNWASWQGGTGNCPGATPSRKATWGQVKALYR